LYGGDKSLFFKFRKQTIFREDFEKLWSRFTTNPGAQAASKRRGRRRGAVEMSDKTDREADNARTYA
jgi:hypothetical protein